MSARLQSLLYSQKRRIIMVPLLCLSKQAMQFLQTTGRTRRTPSVASPSRTKIPLLAADFMNLICQYSTSNPSRKPLVRQQKVQTTSTSPLTTSATPSLPTAPARSSLPHCRWPRSTFGPCLHVHEFNGGCGQLLVLASSFMMNSITAAANMVLASTLTMNSTMVNLALASHGQLLVIASLFMMNSMTAAANMVLASSLTMNSTVAVANF